MKTESPAPLSPEERIAWLAWSTVPEIGPRTVEQLQAIFGSLDEAWRASSAAFGRMITLPQQRGVEHARESFDPHRFSDMLAALSIRAILLPDPDYPPLLREIADPPFVLYVRGALPAQPLLAIVGTRRPTAYGCLMTERLAGAVAQAGIGIVSGLALGIDAVAHAAALDSRGTTVAVFASGLDRIYPMENTRLAEAILDRGSAWLSEHPPGVRPFRHHFPRRNRIIAGLCHGTLVIEAGERSGALITARYALEANRDVLAVPGPATSLQSAGTNRLLQLGAHLVTDGPDILRLFGQSDESNVQPPEPAPASPEAAALLKLLAEGPLDVDQLIEKSRMSSGRVLGLCARLELDGRIRKLADSTYALLG